jgi:L-malate glycosyltransferase
MKICFLATANSIHSHKWIKHFADAGHEVYWISFVPAYPCPIPNVKQYELNNHAPKWISMFYYAFKVKALLKEIEPDILHSHYAGTYGLAGALSGFSPFVLTAWGSDILFAGQSLIKRPLVKYVLSKADLITCDADHMVNTMVRLGTSIRKIRLIYFGVDTVKFSPGQKDKAVRQRLGISEGPMIISLRNLEPIYDVESLIRAVPYVLRELSSAMFVIGGSGSQEDMLKELSLSLGVSESVRFIGSYRNEDLPEYLRMADVYVSTSLSDAGIAASTAEAMACGVPVIITDSGENGKWVHDGRNGFIVPVKDPLSLSQRIVDLLKDTVTSDTFRVAGRKTIEERNSYLKEMGKLESIYAELLKDARH